MAQDVVYIRWMHQKPHLISLSFCLKSLIICLFWHCHNRRQYFSNYYILTAFPQFCVLFLLFVDNRKWNKTSGQVKAAHDALFYTDHLNYRYYIKGYQSGVCNAFCSLDHNFLRKLFSCVIHFSWIVINVFKMGLILFRLSCDSLRKIKATVNS